MNEASLTETLWDVGFEHHPSYKVRVGYDNVVTGWDKSVWPYEYVTQRRYWLQIEDTDLPEEFNRGRKWFLSEHMTESEVVGTAFAAYKAWIEHEIMESFTYRGVKVFNPHVSIKARLRVASEPDNYEYRS